MSVIAGLALIAVAAIAAVRVENSREGLIAEAITLLGGMAGLVLLFYGIYSRPRPSTSVLSASSRTIATEPKVRSANDLMLGTAGILITSGLLSGLWFSGGLLWAGFGFLLLLPMVAGSFYLCLRFLRAPTRDWRVDLRSFRGATSQKKNAYHDQSDRPDDIPVNKSQVVGEKKDASDNQDQTQGH